MKQLLIVLISFGFLQGCDQIVENRTPPIVDVYFSPDGGCTDAIVRQLDAACGRVLVQAYSFTSAPIAKALVAAHRRGVDVRVILDQGQRTEKYSSADFVSHAGIPTFIDDKHAIAHNKIMVIDGEVIVTGSFNFTKSAEERNSENLLVIRDKNLAQKYEDNWERHLRHSKSYEREAEKPREDKKPRETKKGSRGNPAASLLKGR